MKQILIALCTAVLCLTALAGCGTQTEKESDQSAEPEASAGQAVPPESEPAPEATPAPILETVPYWFGEAVEESEPVDESWFEDAVFLGDSRTEGLQIYSGLRAGDFFWHRGMTVFGVDDPEKRVIEVNGEKMTLMEALALKNYAKVYIMIGVNELGYSAQSYDEGLREMVDKVKAIQPDAVIYLQTLPPVNEEVAAANGLGSYINNANINTFNDVVVQVARDKQVALLDVASAFRTDAGDLAEDMAADGVHFYKQGYVLWYDYLRTHTLAPEAYANGQPLPDQPEKPEASAGPASTEPIADGIKETDNTADS